MQWKVLAAIGVALLAAGLANSDTKETKLVTKTVTRTVKTPPKVITRYKVTQPRPADGKITLADCQALRKHDDIRLFIARYGWPDNKDNDLDRLFYPIVDRPHKLCGVGIDRGQIYDVEIHDDLDIL
jgi:hypothetical protein